MTAKNQPALERVHFEDIPIAQQVLDKQIAGLTSLKTSLGAVFTKAVDTLFQAKGRVVVTGVGKSGHVGRKIAATLASTGTPAQFVHAAEASHGDMGMIVPEDVIIALSNSGEAKELSDIIEYARRFRIPLLGMTSKGESTLAKASDLALVMPPHEEGCIMGMAPTTSTTLMMAYGDALAVALMERRGFSRADYKVFHPGGKLGQQLITVGELMHKGDGLPVVRTTDGMGDVLVVMTQKALGCAGVVDENRRLVGIITDGDLRRHLGENMMVKTAAEVMSPDPVTIEADKLAQDAMASMYHNKKNRPISMIFVTDSRGQPVGLIHLHDCLRIGLA